MSLSDSQVLQYLERIGLGESVRSQAPDYALLVQLQQAHLSHVPFENLDIIGGRVPLALDVGSLFEKIIVHGRGGICYELNLLFAELLKALGFDVRYRSATHPKYGDEFDHAFLEVALGDGRHVLADVGLLLNPHAPLELVIGKEQSDGWNVYRFDPAPDLGEGYIRFMQLKDDHESEVLSFGPCVRNPDDYRRRCDWYATSGQSRFTQGVLAAIDTRDCRAMLSHGRYTWSEDGQVMSREFADSEIPQVLKDVFGIRHQS